MQIYTFFHHYDGCHKKTVGEGEKPLTYLNSALKVLLGLHSLPRVPKKKLNFVAQCYLITTLSLSAWQFLYDVTTLMSVSLRQ
jgi:hypothetical protein